MMWWCRTGDVAEVEGHVKGLLLVPRRNGVRHKETARHKGAHITKDQIAHRTRRPPISALMPLPAQKGANPMAGTAWKSNSLLQALAPLDPTR